MMGWIATKVRVHWRCGVVLRSCSFRTSPSLPLPLHAQVVPLWPWFRYRSPAFAVNLAAATCGAAAAAVLYLACLEATNNVGASFLASCLFALGKVPVSAAASALQPNQPRSPHFCAGRLVWHYSIQSEVFSLNNLLLSVLLLLTARFAKRLQPSSRLVHSMAFVSGLCMCNQHTSIIYVAPTAIYVAVTFLRKGKAAGPCIACVPMGSECLHWEAN